MYFRLLLASALIVGVSAAPSEPRAQMACGSRDQIIEKLGAKYGEVRRGGGLAGETAIFELFSSSATGTWTLLRTATNGITCVMAVGQGWQDDPATLASDGSPI